MRKKETNKNNIDDEEFLILEEIIEAQVPSDGILKSKFWALSSTVSGSVKNYATNIGFTINRTSGPFWKNIKESDHITFLGTQFKFKNFKQHYDELLWFSYRKNMPQIEVPDSRHTLKEDTSWGCAIRSCQMMLSTIIMKLFKNRKLSDDKKLRDEILKMFQDVKTKPFSIQNIVNLGNKNYNTKAGEWWKPTTVLFTMKDQLSRDKLFEDVACETLHELKSQKIHICMDNTIDIDEIENEICEGPTFYNYQPHEQKNSGSTQNVKKPSLQMDDSDKQYGNSCRKIRISSYEIISTSKSNLDDSFSDCDSPSNDKPKNKNCSTKEFKISTNDPTPHNKTERNATSLLHNFQVLSNSNITKQSDIEYQEEKNDFKEVNVSPIFIVQVVMTGYQTPEPESLKLIDDLLRLKYSVGLIGGVPGKAYYVLGEVKEQYIYLDPHYAQEHVKEDNLNKKNIKTYNPHDIRLLKKSSADTSMAQGFLLYTDYDARQFYAELKSLKEKYGESFFLNLKDKHNKCPNFEENENDDGTDDFIMLETEFDDPISTEPTMINKSSTLKAKTNKNDTMILEPESNGDIKYSFPQTIPNNKNIEDMINCEEWDKLSSGELIKINSRKNSEKDQLSFSTLTGRDNRSRGDSKKDQFEIQDKSADDSIMII